MLNTMSSFSLRAHARMFSASSRFIEKIVVEMPKLNGTRFCSSCMARIVSSALSKPRFTLRTLLCISPTPSIETRVLKMMPRSWHISATLRHHRDAALRRQAGGVDAELAEPRQPVEHDRARSRPGRSAWSARRPRGSRSRCSSRGGLEGLARSPRGSCRPCGRPAPSCCTSRSARRRRRCSGRSGPSGGSAGAWRHSALMRSRGALAAALRRYFAA